MAVWATWPSDDYFYPGTITKLDDSAAWVDFVDGTSNQVNRGNLQRLELSAGDAVMAQLSGDDYRPAYVAYVQSNTDVFVHPIDLQLVDRPAVCVSWDQLCLSQHAMQEWKLKRQYPTTAAPTGLVTNKRKRADLKSSVANKRRRPSSSVASGERHAMWDDESDKLSVKSYNTDRLRTPSSKRAYSRTSAMSIDAKDISDNNIFDDVQFIITSGVSFL
jgi:hypothetical protein